MSDKVYLDYTELEFDHQYDVMPFYDFWEFEREYIRLGKIVQQDYQNFLNVKYGEGERERLDIFPAKSPNAPVVFYIHGGYWRYGDTYINHFVTPGIVDQDITLVMPTYDIAPGTRLDVIVEQVRKAFEWTCHNIGDYGGNPQQITVAGHSVGGHLASMMVTTDWSSRGLDNRIIKGMIAIGGLYDLEALRHCRYLKEDEKLDLQEEEARLYSSIFLKPAVQCPVLLVVGEDEAAEYHRHSRELAEAWKDHRPGIEYLSYPDKHHCSIVLELTDANTRLSQLFGKMARRR